MDESVVFCPMCEGNDVEQHEDGWLLVCVDCGFAAMEGEFVNGGVTQWTAA